MPLRSMLVTHFVGSCYWHAADEANISEFFVHCLQVDVHKSSRSFDTAFSHTAFSNSTLNKPLSSRDQLILRSTQSQPPFVPTVNMRFGTILLIIAPFFTLSMAAKLAFTTYGEFHCVDQCWDFKHILEQDDCAENPLVSPQSPLRLSHPLTLTQLLLLLLTSSTRAYPPSKPTFHTRQRHLQTATCTPTSCRAVQRMARRRSTTYRTTLRTVRHISNASMLRSMVVYTAFGGTVVIEDVLTRGGICLRTQKRCVWCI